MTTRQALFATCSPGLENIAAAEFRSLGFMPAQAVPGGVELSGTATHLYRANLWSRTSSRVLVRLGEFQATAFEELVRKAGGLPWERHLRPGQPVRVNATARKSRLHHTGAIAERVARSIGSRLGVEPAWTLNKSMDDAEAQALVVVRFEHDRCRVSIDSSGEDLHRRGYRLATAKAPLRETLAAGLLLACQWDPATPLIDPFCGSGTIAVEAALMAQGIAPGLNRRFAFMDWPAFEPETWEGVLAQATAKSLPRAPAPILASDRDAGAIEAATANAARAGVEADIRFARRAISAMEAPMQRGWVITNPPYGVRVGDAKGLRDLYAQFGHVLRRECSGWRVGVLVGDSSLLQYTELRFGAPLPLVSGGLRVHLAQAEVP